VYCAEIFVSCNFAEGFTAAVYLRNIWRFQ
jgi:hypothetical protein